MGDVNRKVISAVPELFSPNGMLLTIIPTMEFIIGSSRSSNVGSINITHID